MRFWKAKDVTSIYDQNSNKLSVKISVKKLSVIFIFKRKQVPSYYFQKWTNNCNNYLNGVLYLWNLLPVIRCHKYVSIYIFYKDDFIKALAQILLSFYYQGRTKLKTSLECLFYGTQKHMIWYFLSDNQKIIFSFWCQFWFKD